MAEDETRRWLETADNDGPADVAPVTEVDYGDGE